MVMPAGLEPNETQNKRARLADPALRRAIEAAVRRRIQGDDAEDVVQAALADVLSAARVPEDPEEFRRFVFAVTRNKVFDHFRRRVREVPEEEGQEPAAAEAPLSARDILRWAEGKLPDSESQHTLEWMLREGDGEKLEQIARDANLPAPRVRQRVSRLRRFLRERWAAEVLLAVLGLALLIPPAVYYYQRHHRPEDIAKHDPELRPEPLPTPDQQARELRRMALERCQNGEDVPCLEGLDRARALDPQGDAAPEIVNARRAAAAHLATPPTPSALPMPSATPIPTALTVPSGTPVQPPAPLSKATPKKAMSFSSTPMPSDTAVPNPSVDSASDSFGSDSAAKAPRKGK